MDVVWIIGSSLMIGAMVGGTVFAILTATRWTAPPPHIHKWEPFHYPTDQYEEIRFRCIQCLAESESWKNYKPNYTGYTGWADK